MKRKLSNLIQVRCEDCGDEWIMYRAGRCPICGGVQVVVARFFVVSRRRLARGRR